MTGETPYLYDTYTPHELRSNHTYHEGISIRDVLDIL